MNLFSRVVSVATIALFCSSVIADSHARQVITVLGYDGNYWHPYTAVLDGKIRRSDWQKRAVIENSVAVTRQPGTGAFFVKQDDGQIVQFLENENKEFIKKALPVLESERLNYTHLRAYNKGFLAISLKGGKSRETTIIDVPQTLKPQSLINQAAAQFHPLKTNNSLYYAHVSCRLACDPVIQEVWRRDQVSGKTQQLTLLNSTSYMHSVDAEEQYGYISSNQSGYYHIGRLNLLDSNVVWLTQGQVTDSYPSIANTGDLYFIRRDQQGTRLMRIFKKGSLEAQAIALPKSIKKIRYLEINNQ